MFKILISLLFIQASLASSIPDNRILRPVTDKSQAQEERFHALIDQVENTYRNYIESFGKTFSVTRDWQNPQVNAAAWKKENSYNFKIYGGLYRFETITDDAFLLVACHEVGHLVGGAPTYKPFNDGSSEGQADYFSVAKCFRKVIKGEDHESIIKGIPLEPLALSECAESFSIHSEEYSICLRASLAIGDMANTFKAISDIEILPTINTPDPYVRMFTIFNGYPNPQCRVDTLFAGSLCQVSEEIDNDFSLKLYNEGNCSVEAGHTRGLRPKCWYVPRGEDI
ncbi:hypothetical protein [Halobacteriovorax sp. JY17]|uniref:hypothetical protein n=1 Tax=Halobacteriovorax sp. JY17 TaxID=2014617 RepID=UPI000C451D86|nr:hypothetical protein [Halobacteriovorax sp. JY17]PIK15148.1 MAG: hypothetical protein CES88_00115 [Halobacteriovorax sp. JY17]